MGDKEGPSFDYDWKPTPLLPLLPLLAFLLLLMWRIFKQRESWAVILPVLILNAFLLPLGYLTGSPFFYNLIGISFGMAGLLLLLERINQQNPRIRLFLACAVVIFFGLLTVSLFPGNNAWERFKSFLTYGLVSLIMLFSIVLAMRLSRKRFTDATYLAWLLVSCMIFSMVYLLGSTFVSLLTTEFNPIMLLAAPITVAMSVFMGMGLFIFMLPFIVLCLTNKIYRLKFFGIFKT